MIKSFELDLDLKAYTKNNYLTHNFHPYPAKFIPQIPKEIINKYTQEGQNILDPFCGSGTTLVEAKLQDRNAIGIDLNPIAYISSKTKTTFLTNSQMDKILEVKERICKEIFEGICYKTPQFYNIDHWFKKEVQEELSVIYHHIKKLKEEDIKNFISVAFTSIITKVSNQESDTRYAAVEKKFNKNDVAHLFEKKIIDMINRLKEFMSVAYDSKVEVKNADSTNFKIASNSIDLCLTSPPYMNSYDYYLYHKHRMNWLDINHKEVQKKEFGSRNKHNDLGKGVQSYTNAISENAKIVYSALKKNGIYCVVIGDSILNGELIKMNEVYDKVFSKVGYCKVYEFIFDQRKYTRSFTPNIKSKYKDSYIISYQKR